MLSLLSDWWSSLAEQYSDTLFFSFGGVSRPPREKVAPILQNIIKQRKKN